mmetsp:Transcript_28017/g.54882  ORF Transcript_28017/g.54882 Transcript_28017/m.54882 type:complete len:207 (-) Transcript_28017:180-800(-)
MMGVSVRMTTSLLVATVSNPASAATRKKMLRRESPARERRRIANQASPPVASRLLQRNAVPRKITTMPYGRSPSSPLRPPSTSTGRRTPVRTNTTTPTTGGQKKSKVTTTEPQVRGRSAILFVPACSTTLLFSPSPPCVFSTLKEHSQGNGSASLRGKTTRRTARRALRRKVTKIKISAADETIFSLSELRLSLELLPSSSPKGQQ